jgi:hypothetical protein
LPGTKYSEEYSSAGKSNHSHRGKTYISKMLKIILLGWMVINLPVTGIIVLSGNVGQCIGLDFRRAALNRYIAWLDLLVFHDSDLEEMGY